MNQQDRRRRSVLALIVAGSSTSFPIAAAQDLLWTESFETEPGSWVDLERRASEYDAPVDGLSYAIVPGGGEPAVALLPFVLESKKRYVVTAWARSVYSTEHLDALRSRDPEDLPPGIDVEAVAEIGLFTDDALLAERAAIVSPTPILGDPETASNDDGANVWVDTAAGFRHAFAENHFHQPLASDPILDPWFQGPMPLAEAQNDMMAKGVAIFPNGTRRLYGFNSNNPFCEGTGENCQAMLFTEVTGRGDPEYDQPSRPSNNYIAWHRGDEDPWLGDPHVYVDPTTGRSWLSFGGGTGMYVVELDRETGFIAGFDGPVDFDQHPDVFTKVADWSGDEWTEGSTWFEGAALWHEGDFWYFFTSNGNLGFNYTIRLGRGTSPTGPFHDKQGRNLNALDPSEEVFGSSFLLGDDADQLVPGHPHLWQEGDRYFLGYDYRSSRIQSGREEADIMGIRELHWENGWPTIWKPIRLEFDADDFPEQLGRPIRLVLLSLGEPESIVAYDHVTITSTGVDCPGDFDLDSQVDGPDLGILLTSWGPGKSTPDLNRDGQVNGVDLGLLFARWGPCR